MNVNSINGQPLIGGGIILIATTGQSGPEVTLPAGYAGSEGFTIRVVFPSGYTAANSSSRMTLNGVPVVSNQGGTLAPLPIHRMIEGVDPVYKVLMPNVVLEMYYSANYDGNNAQGYVVVGNPVVLSTAEYTIYADGSVGSDPVGTVIALYKKSNPYGFAYLNGETWDGRTVGGVTYPNMQTDFPKLFAYLGTNVLPDYREYALVGAEQNTTDAGITKHDVYTQGDAKQDQVIQHNHAYGNDTDTYFDYVETDIYAANPTQSNSLIVPHSSAFSWSTTTKSVNRLNSETGTVNRSRLTLKVNTMTKVNFPSGTQTNKVTRGKRKAVFFYIKAM